MRPVQAFGWASFLAVCMAMPATAQPFDGQRGIRGRQWDALGTVEFGPRAEVEQAWREFGGPAERLRLLADPNGATCRRVTTTFANGRTRQVFSGVLRQDRPAVIDLTRDERNVRRITLDCRSLGRGNALVTIAADINARDYRSWWDNPRFRGRPGFGRDLVLTIGRESFGQRGRREQVMAHFGGQRLQAIGLRAVDGAASCRRVAVRFKRGHQQVLIRAADRATLRPGRTRWFDLQGDQRDVNNLVMVCDSAGRARNVTIEVVAERDIGRPSARFRR